MDRFIITSCLKQPTSRKDHRQRLNKPFNDAIDQLVSVVVGFANAPIDPTRFKQFEQRLLSVVMNLGRVILEMTLNCLEIDDVDDLPGVIHHKSKNFRRLTKKTKHSDILSLFGSITLMRSTYRKGSRGKTIAPLELTLGIMHGATPGAMDLVGQEIAATGATQCRAIEVIAQRTGTRIGVSKLRRITGFLEETMSPYRERFQLERLQSLAVEAVNSGKKPVLAISRDGVTICIAPQGYFEVAAIATVSVFADGKCLGTVYLSTPPEENQESLSQQLTSLVSAVIRSHGDLFHTITYVSDAGKVETSYWTNVLSRFYVDGQRISIVRTLDYYHASLRLTTIADSLRLTSSQREQWLSRVRSMLKKSGGWGRVMRSISKMERIHGIKRGQKAEYTKAVKYLRRHRRFMNYAARKAEGCPIGSGIVESGCKQLVSERMKLSGMRWKEAGMKSIMTLRSIVLSKTWNATFEEMLLQNHAVNTQYSSAA